MHLRLSPFHAATALAVAMLAAAPFLYEGRMLAIHIALIGILYFLVVGAGVTFPRLQWFGPSLNRLPTSRRVVALTFDDGPDPQITPALLDLLRTRGVRATFFWIGEAVLRNPDLARRAAAEGHLLGNHSFSHRHGTNFLRVRRLRDDIANAQAAFKTATGTPPLWFRPPMGLTNPRVFRVARELGLRVVGWTARGLDQEERDPKRVVRRLTSRLKPGAVFVLHDGANEGGCLLPAVSSLIDKLEARGYQAVRLDET